MDWVVGVGAGKEGDRLWSAVCERGGVVSGVCGPGLGSQAPVLCVPVWGGVCSVLRFPSGCVSVVGRGSGSLE